MSFLILFPFSIVCCQIRRTFHALPVNHPWQFLRDLKIITIMIVAFFFISGRFLQMFNRRMHTKLTSLPVTQSSEWVSEW